MARAGTAAILLLLAVPALVAGSPAATLDAQNIALLREAALAAPDLTTSADPVAAVLRELARRHGSSAARGALIAGALQSDPALVDALLALRDRRLLLTCRAHGAFEACWDERQRDADGRLSASPTDEDLDDLASVVGSVELVTGVAVPRPVPYRIDLEARQARAVPASSLDWGVVTTLPRDRAAVARLALGQASGVAALVGALATLEACSSPECRGAELERARANVVSSGYVPLVDALAAAHLGGDDDPASASVMLVMDHLSLAHGADVRRSLLVGVPSGGDERARKEAIRRLVGQTAARLDREVLAGLDRWQRARLREQLATRPRVQRSRSGPPR